MINQRKFYGTVLAGILLLIGLGYAYFNTDLSINGDALFKRATWNIHFVSPPTVSSGSVSGASVTQAAHVTGTNNDTVEYSVTLTNPKDYYEFTVVAENTGTMDAMISTVSNKVYSGNTEITLPDYLKSEVRHSNGAKIKEKQLLAANSTHTFKVRVYYRDDVTNNQLPSADTALSFRFNVTYVQADNTSIQVVAPAFNEATPWEDVIDGIQNGVITPNVGDTKCVALDGFTTTNNNGCDNGEFLVRIANTSTPEECSTIGFSQTACGLVLEFADVITKHRMNPWDGNYDSDVVGNGNVGGWPASEMRTYVNSDIYNALPTALKNAIIDTHVVSGHGDTSGETNFTSTDKLYLLDRQEVYGDNYQYNTAASLNRQMDYYASQGVTISSYAAAIKQYNNWWLRTALSFHSYAYNYVYLDGQIGNNGTSNTHGVSPAFRIA